MERARTCPRCGYDLSGTIATWQTSCPLDGVCSECGLTIEWGLLWDHVSRPPKWYVESKLGIRQFISTWVRHAWPSRLWRAIDMRQEIRPWRLVLFAMGGIIVCHLLVAGMELALEAYHYQQYTARWRGFARIRPMPTLRSWIDPWVIAWPYKAVYGLDGALVAVQVVVFPALVGLLIPSLCYLFSDSLRFEPVRLRHLIRIALLWLPTSVLAGSLVLCVDTIRRQLAPSMAVSTLEWIVPLVMLVMYVLWPVIFWHRAFRTYLRMSRPRIMTAVIFSGAMVIGLALIILPQVLAP